MSPTAFYARVQVQVDLNVHLQTTAVGQSAVARKEQQNTRYHKKCLKLMMRIDGVALVNLDNIINSAIHWVFL